jgi:hypothetical protein
MDMEGDMADPIAVDILVVGGGLGGVAAAIAAARSNASVLLIEAGEWLGGQLTAQGVCTPDEDPIYINGNPVAVVETCGATNTYKYMKHLCRAFYRDQTTLTAAEKNKVPLNIGNCWVNLGFATEALVAAGVLSQMLTDAGVQPMMQTHVTDFTRAERVITDVTIEGPAGSQQVAPKYILDATETGELLPLFGLDWVIGSEVTDEPANMGDHPDWIQPITFPFALERRPHGEDYTIPKPDSYDDVAARHDFTLVDGPIREMFTSPVIDPATGQKALPFWTYRRIVDHTLFNDPRYSCDIATINVAANDFKDAVYPTGDLARDQQVLDAARNLSLCYLYWLQKYAPRDDGRPGTGWPELKPLTTFFNTPDAISPMPYIRESRRIAAIGTVKQQDIQKPEGSKSLQRAQNFSDSCGIGNYGMDVHAGANQSQEFESGTWPYQIPSGALIPKDVDNVLAAGKCLGVTHLTNGAYRLHPQEWNVGESAGALASLCASQGVAPAMVHASDDLLVTYQNHLLKLGIPLFWWTDITSDHPQFGPIQMLGVRGIFVGFPNSLDFKPDADFPPEAQRSLVDKDGNQLPWPGTPMSRAEAAEFIATQLKLWLE